MFVDNISQIIISPKPKLTEYTNDILIYIILKESTLTYISSFTWTIIVSVARHGRFGKIWISQMQVNQMITTMVIYLGSTFKDCGETSNRLYVLNILNNTMILVLLQQYFHWYIIIYYFRFQHCELEPLFGECGLVTGVGGPGTDFGMNHFGDPDCNQ